MIGAPLPHKSVQEIKGVGSGEVQISQQDLCARLCTCGHGDRGTDLPQCYSMARRTGSCNIVHSADVLIICLSSSIPAESKECSLTNTCSDVEKENYSIHQLSLQCITECMTKNVMQLTVPKPYIYHIQKNYIIRRTFSNATNRFTYSKNKNGRLATESFKSVMLLWDVLSEIFTHRRVAKRCDYLLPHCEGTE